MFSLLPGSVLAELQPRINLSMQSTDNLLNARSQERQTSSLIVNPGLSYEFGTPRLKFLIDLDLEAGRYNNSSADNYEDATILGSVAYQPTSRLRFDAKVSQHWGHDARGTGRTEVATGNLGRTPDRYTQKNFDGSLTYGIAGAKGQLILSAAYLDREYTNNRSATRSLDHDETGVGATFKWRVAPKTSLLLEARYRDFDYDTTPVGFATLDSDEQRYFIGAEWEATYKTTGSIRIGRYRKNFDSVVRNDISGGAWEVAVDWKPRSYSTVNLSTGRTTGESTGIGDVQVTDYYRAAWTHGWLDRLSTTLSYDNRDVEYEGDTGRREDEIDSYRATVNYKMRRWLDLDAGLEHINNDSSTRAFSYDRNTVFLNARIRF